MSTQTTAPDRSSEALPVAPPPLAATRPWYWSVRRELWENRSLYMAPLAIASVLMFGFLLSMITLPSRMSKIAGLEPARQISGITKPFSIVAALLIVSTFIVGVFYCIEALHGERRDRSLLFWKSLPVSDRTAVLAKLAVPLLVLPVVAIAVTLAVQIVMLLVSTVVLLASGSSPALLWRLPLVQITIVMFYGVFAHALWFAPLYSWLLLVSAWARAKPLLWVVLPPLVLGMVERVAFGSSLVGRLLRYRVLGAMGRAFHVTKENGGDILSLSELTPVRFLLSPGLWGGLLVAALFIAGAIHFRRHREPI
jgi:ABC-2 type transport system permease protein